MQVRYDDHTSRQIELKEAFERVERSLDEDEEQFFRLFQESTFEESRAAARKMKKFAKRQPKYNQRVLLLHSLYVLARSDSEMLSWPNSSLLVLLEFVDPNELSGDEDAPLQEGETRVSPLNYLAVLADPFDYSTHENQLILAKQLIEHGANVNAASNPQCQTPLHNACYTANVTNLDFVELLLEKGANPNTEDRQGLTPLMHTVPGATGAAKFLLNWPTTDANITARSGESFLARVRLLITDFPTMLHSLTALTGCKTNA
jgi:hypothetical protein